MAKEIFCPITGYEGVYEISNFGRVKSLARICPHPKGDLNIKERILKPGVSASGYAVVNLQYLGKRLTTSVHRLVAIMWVREPKEFEQVNHIDGNKLNNKADNLEWVTASDNCKYNFTMLGKKARSGEDNNLTKLSREQVIEIKKLLKTLKPSEVSKITGVNRKNISSIKCGRSWRHLDES